MTSGRLGILAVLVAIVGALGVSWIMSLDVTETEVTAYEYLADVTGVFETSEVPAYTDYNPSKNYTGYYTADSTVDGVRYFDGVNYTQSRPNTFKLNLQPIEFTTSTITMDGNEGRQLPTVFYYTSSTHYETLRPYALTLAEFLTAYNLTGTGIYEIVSASDEYTTSGAVVPIMPASYFSSYSYVAIPGVDEIYGARGQLIEKTATVSLACRYDSATGQATVYVDRDMTEMVGIYDETGVYVISEASGFIGKTLTVTHIVPADPTYLDPSAGVSL